MIEYNQNELDIVIPDIKTLEKDPKKTLLVCIPKSDDPKIVPAYDNIVITELFYILGHTIATQPHDC